MITKEGYDRIEFLRNAVNDGEDAKAVLRVTQKYREQIEKDTLSTLAEEDDRDKITECIAYYKAVVKLCERLESAVTFGDRKEKALEKVLKDHK